MNHRLIKELITPELVDPIKVAYKWPCLSLCICTLVIQLSMLSGQTNQD